MNIVDWLSQFVTFSNPLITDIISGHIVFAVIIIIFSSVVGALFSIGKKK